VSLPGRELFDLAGENAPTLIAQDLGEAAFAISALALSGGPKLLLLKIAVTRA